jgi:hypothetical protein
MHNANHVVTCRQINWAPAAKPMGTRKTVDARRLSDTQRIDRLTPHGISAVAFQAF